MFKIETLADLAKIETLANLANTIFKYTWDKESRSIIKDILKIIDINIDFEEKSLSYDDINITKDQAKQLYKWAYKITYLPMTKFDVECIEKILEISDSQKISNMFPIFSCIGWSLVNDEGRWRIKYNGE